MNSRGRFHRRILITFACSIAALAVLPAAQAQACTCDDAPAEQKFRELPAAFTGKLLDVRESSDGRSLVYRYRVTRDYKGNLRERIRVLDPQDTSCSMPGGTVGKRYSMFLYRHKASRVSSPRRWASNLCLQSTKTKLERASRRAASSSDGGPQGSCSA